MPSKVRYRGKKVRRQVIGTASRFQRWRMVFSACGHGVVWGRQGEKDRDELALYNMLRLERGSANLFREYEENIMTIVGISEVTVVMTVTGDEKYLRATIHDNTATYPGKGAFRWSIFTIKMF